MNFYGRMKRLFSNNRYMYSLYRKVVYIKDRTLHASEFESLQTNGEQIVGIIQKALGGKESFFFDAGTLLGIIRENRFLKHDNDIDVAVYAKTIEDVQRVRALLQEAGCVRVRSYSIFDETVEDAFSVLDFRFDVFYCKHDGEKDFYYAMYQGPELAGDKERMNVVKLCFTPIRETKLIPFAGTMINVPADPELYLSEKYGENWRIPDKYFKFWNAPNAVKTTLIGRRAT